VSARAELIRALAAAAEPPTPALAAVAGALGLPRLPTAAEHTDLFTFQLHPYASVHLGPEGQLGGIARDRVAGFLRALGVTPPTEPDHLVVLLSAYAELVDLDDVGTGERARHARTALLHEHLWPWVPGFATRAAELGAAPYRRWATLLHDALEVEVAHLGPPPTLPAHLRDAPGLPDPREAPPGSFLDGLLAPVRSGLVLARADLARIARELDLGLRIGERAYLLRRSWPRTDLPPCERWRTRRPGSTTRSAARTPPRRSVATASPMPVTCSPTSPPPPATPCPSPDDRAVVPVVASAAPMVGGGLPARLAA
jgi:TorA maturation chaperone TorD